jgi:hypothetical protein
MLSEMDAFELKMSEMNYGEGSLGLLDKPEDNNDEEEEDDKEIVFCNLEDEYH